ncbi:MAG: acyltransferase [Paludibacter sp.]|nr:acyltransferase [Paludibacter sp.]MDD3489701.1 acyltransferase [Paludibacter sp.]
MQDRISTAFADSKPHYALLDGLRGVAALLVVWYHIFEGYAFAGGTMITTVNHGYLAVDFFFMLSGFVVSYAYDDRLGKSLTLKNFFKRRLIRLHPMVVMGAIVGLIAYCIQGCVQWDGTQVSVTNILISLLLGMLLIPVFPGAAHDVRGNGEMFPLNGPGWSLFFEYIGNILYALFIRRFSNKVLIFWTIFTGVGLGMFSIFDVAGYGSIGIGWTMDAVNFFGGLFRMIFPFSMGMLLARNFRPLKIKGAFWICSLILAVLFHVPYIEGTSFHFNGLFEFITIAGIFPVVLLLGASGTTTDKITAKISKFLGEISFPLYMVHYPVMYLFYAWLIDKKLYTLGETWQVALLGIAGIVMLAYLCLKLYDEPVRKWLGKKFISKK